jgi:hypothetical protein
VKPDEVTIRILVDPSEVVEWIETLPDDLLDRLADKLAERMADRARMQSRF